MVVSLNFQEDASRQKVISLCRFHEARRPSTYTYKILFLLLKKIQCLYFQNQSVNPFVIGGYFTFYQD